MLIGYMRVSKQHRSQCRTVEPEQIGEAQAEYGEELIERLTADLIARCGRGILGSQCLADEGVLSRMALSKPFCSFGQPMSAYFP